MTRLMDDTLNVNLQSSDLLAFEAFLEKHALLHGPKLFQYKDWRKTNAGSMGSFQYLNFYSINRQCSITRKNQEEHGPEVK
jgi:hypothetical protein